MSEATPPPAGGAKYGLIGLVLMLLAIGLYCGTQESEPEQPAVVETPETPPEPRTTQFGPEIEIPEEVEDAGVDLGVDTGPEEEVATMMGNGMHRVPRECGGNLDVAAVSQVVASQRRQVRACYERQLKQNNVLQGTVNVRLIVDRDGSVGRVSVGGSLRDNEVFACVRRLARRWQFPRPTGGSCAQVNAPFTLTPRP